MNNKSFSPYIKF